MVRTFHSLCYGETGRGDFIEPDRLRSLNCLSPEKMSVQGAGLSLVGASFGDGNKVIGMRSYNRIRHFDVKTGILEVEAGATHKKEEG